MNASVPVYAAVSLAMAFALAGIYGLLPEPRWLYVALIHSPIAWLVLWRGPKAPDAEKGRLWLRKAALYAAPLYLALIVSLGILSRIVVPGAAPLQGPAWDSQLLLTVLWIPFIEECIFRGGVGRWLQGKLGAFWGIYLSALLFATLHSNPPQNWMPPLGPFLLAVCCELIVRITGRLAPAILLHACCNASPLLLASLDARWLHWLSALYLDLS